MELFFVRTDPVQEIAAEPATLDLLKDILRPKTVEPRATPELLAAARSCGWPLVYDDTLRPGIVHCRPTPGAPAPPSAAEMLEYFRRLMPEPDDPPVQCWHTEPDTPCDWNVCRQPERLAAGDRGTDPARATPPKERP